MPKIVKLEKRYPGIINYVDKLLDEGKLGYRRIARELTRKYLVGISHESIRRYAIFRCGNISENKPSSREFSLYYKIAPIRRRQL